MVLGKLPVPGRPSIWIAVGQGPNALAAGGGCLDILTLICPFSPLSPSLWEMARYRLKYCLKEPLKRAKTTNQPTTFKINGSQLSMGMHKIGCCGNCFRYQVVFQRDEERRGR